MTKEPLVSVIIPVKKVSKYITEELRPALEEQSYKNWELIIVDDKEYPGRPGEKRDFGAKKAKGEILAFIDDDAYPDKNWLKAVIKAFQTLEVCGLCGPGLTPPNDNLRQRVSGCVWSSSIGAGGAGTYRNRIEEKRYVDDYPTFNLLIKKRDFEKVGGFDSKFWPGEDTKLCHDLVYKLGKKILYDPNIIVYHNRRPVFLSHLKQVGRYGLHRGYFAKILPKTSLRIGYFIPSLFTLGLIFGPFIYLPVYFLILLIYFSIILYEGIKVTKNLAEFFLFVPAVFLTHVYYGLMFLRGLAISRLDD